MTPTEALAAAVLRQAVADLFRPAANTARSSSDGNPALADKESCIAFLTDTRGAWAESRRHWSIWAGKDPDKLRASVVAFLEGDDRLVDTFKVFYGTADRLAVFESSVAESRRLYAERTRKTADARAAWLDANRRRKLNLDRQRHLDAIRREKAERRESMRQWQDGRRSAYEAEIARIVYALKDGPRTITQVCHAVALTYLPARSRLEEAARRGLVECVGKGVWQQTNSNKVENTVVEPLPSAAAY